jgi:chromosomal replication initiator protein
MKAEQAWQAARGQLQIEMPRAAFDTWVHSAELVSYEDGSFIIGVQNAYARDWLDSRLSSTVKRLLTGIMNRTIEIRFIVWQDENEQSEIFEENFPV